MIKIELIIVNFLTITYFFFIKKIEIELHGKSINI